MVPHVCIEQEALVQALGAFVALLDEIDDEVLRLCSLATNHIVTGWIYLWPKQYPAAHEAIAGLLSALESRAQALQLVVQRLVDTMLAKTLAKPDLRVASGELPPSVRRVCVGWSCKNVCVPTALPEKPDFLHAGPSVVADGDRRPNWEFYQHLWRALLTVPEEQADGMDTGQLIVEAHGSAVCSPLIGPQQPLSCSAHSAMQPFQLFALQRTNPARRPGDSRSTRRSCAPVSPPCTTWTCTTTWPCLRLMHNRLEAAKLLDSRTRR